MKAPGTQARRNRLANAPRRLVAQDDGGQHVLAAGTCALRHGERGGDQRGAGMDDIPCRSLSSEAAASLMTALTRAASATGSLGPESNQTEASGVRRAPWRGYG